MNSEVLLFAFLLGGLALSGWLFLKHDSLSDTGSWFGKTMWITCVVVGVFFGIHFRLNIY
ncbi:MAG: hypothetical protein AAF514_22760 [Verrucomicrobiota bacterium]